MRCVAVRPSAIRPFAMDHAAIDEPRERVVEAGELLDRETILPVIGVQEVEGVLEIDAVGVALIGARNVVCKHLDNHCISLLTGYARKGLMCNQ